MPPKSDVGRRHPHHQTSPVWLQSSGGDIIVGSLTTLWRDMESTCPKGFQTYLLGMVWWVQQSLQACCLHQYIYGHHRSAIVSKMQAYIWHFQGHCSKMVYGFTMCFHQYLPIVGKEFSTPIHRHLLQEDVHYKLVQHTLESFGAIERLSRMIQ